MHDREFDDLRGTPHVLVVGDLMIDRYLWGRGERISPEAPVPVVDVNRETFTLGGAGNVASNLVSLGARASIASVVGAGASSARLEGLLAQHSIEAAALVVDPSRPITEKTRVMATNQQVVRYDLETRAPITAELESQLLEAISALLPDVAAVVLSDYGKGVLTSAVTRQVIDRCKAAGVPVLVDPKDRDYRKYTGASAITPNKKEASEAAGIDIVDQESLDRAGTKLRTDHQLDACLITLGEGGMALFREGRCDRLATRAREVFDVTGAGDTVIAAMAFALGQGADPLVACRFANTAAGVVVGKVGAATTTFEEIERFAAELRRTVSVADKLRGVDAAVAVAEAARAVGKTVVFTNGCFDILHAGHVKYLEDAAALGDLLVVGLNTDDSVKRLKGPERPINGQDDRAFVMSALQFVDCVVLFGEDTPLDLITRIRPDVLVKGGDYTIDTIVGADVVQGYGGRVTTIPLVPGKSSTATIERMKETR